jgi:hypothetical protein
MACLIRVMDPINDTRNAHNHSARVPPRVSQRNAIVLNPNRRQLVLEVVRFER